MTWDDMVEWNWTPHVWQHSTAFVSMFPFYTAPPMACLALLNIAPSMKWTAMDTDWRAISCSKHPKGICDTICKHIVICIVRTDSAWFWWDLNMQQDVLAGPTSWKFFCSSFSESTSLFQLSLADPLDKSEQNVLTVRLSMTSRGMQIQNHFLCAVRKSLEVSKLK